MTPASPGAQAATDLATAAGSPVVLGGAAVAVACMAGWAALTAHVRRKSYREPKLRHDPEHGLVDGYGNTYTRKDAWNWDYAGGGGAGVPMMKKTRVKTAVLDGGTAPTPYDDEWGSAAGYRAAEEPDHVSASAEPA